jgi:hypothetical protein
MEQLLVVLVEQEILDQTVILVMEQPEETLDTLELRDTVLQQETQDQQAMLDP